MSRFERNGYRTIEYTISKPVIGKLKSAWQDHPISAYPDTFSGRGIVMCAGGLSYFTCAWIAIRKLRALGCQLPIELWHAGNELSPDIIQELEQYNVSCRDFFDYDNIGLKGCMLKPLSIVRSSFKEVFFLDADNICVSDPTFLFETAAYKEYGAIFWPDFWKTAKDNPIWKIIGIPYEDTFEQESGQMVIDKERCWQPLNLSLYFNRLTDIYYRLLMGDKDTFRFAWRAFHQPFYMVQTPVATCGYMNGHQFMGNTMVQHDLEGKILFLHRNLVKWDITLPREICWEKIKSFGKDAGEQIRIFTTPSNTHNFMDFEGAYMETDFREQLGDLEHDCLAMLQELRDAPFYKKFLLYTHLARNRFMGNIAFQLT